LILVTLGGSACRERGNVRRIPVGTATCREIRIIERAGSMPADVLAAVDSQGTIVLPPLPRELAQIQDILVSPGKELALVISVGEGHPWINVYRIADWLAPIPVGSEGVEPFRTMDPYPFDWTDVAWRNSNKVGFRSSGDYTRFDHVSRRPAGEIDAPVKSWIWDTAADNILPG
jgi:hypothetical protein